MTVSDYDGDGWDDIWVDLNFTKNRGAFHGSTEVDTDGDGITDYQEMLLWRDPHVATPPPREPTAGELADAELRKAERERARRERWARAREGLLPYVSERMSRPGEARRAERIEAYRAKEKNVPEYLRGGEVQSLEQAETHGVNALWPGGAENLDLDGTGVTLGMIELQTPHPHAELDQLSYHGSPPPSPADHPTSVAGVMIASGGDLNSDGTDAAGMAPEAALATFRDNPLQDFSANFFAAESLGVVALNASFNKTPGWNHEQNPSRWNGYPHLSTAEPNLAGQYTELERDVDNGLYLADSLVFVRSAGNSRNFYPHDGPGEGGLVYERYDENDNLVLEDPPDPDDPNDPGQGLPHPGAADGGYDSLPSTATAKNALAVGADGSAGPWGRSSQGPTDDGRIKPDLMAAGEDVYVLQGTADYGVESGTSLAAPVAAGISGLMEQHRNGSYLGAPMWMSSTHRALLIHSATDLGPWGPDYATGWGLVDAGEAAEIIGDDAEHDTKPHIKEMLIGADDGASFEVGRTVGLGDFGGESIATTAEVKVTIAWNDPAPESSRLPPRQSIDVDTSMLVNDLELRVIFEDPEQTLEPWILDPANPAASATRGVNSLDNVEQIVVPPGGGKFTVEITVNGQPVDENGDPADHQAVSVILTGNDPEFAPELETRYFQRVGPTEWGIGFGTIAGLTYQLEHSTDLATWTDDGGPFVANDSLTLLLVESAAERGFWRLREIVD